MGDILILRGGFGEVEGMALHLDIEAAVLAHFAAGGCSDLTWGIGGSPMFEAFDTTLGVPFSNMTYGAESGWDWRNLFVCHYHHISKDVELWREGPSHACCFCPLFLTLRKRDDGSVHFGLTEQPIVRWGDVGFGFTIFFSGRFGFSPGEMMDFFTGWAGLDLAGDDHKPANERRWSERGGSVNLITDR